MKKIVFITVISLIIIICLFAYFKGNPLSVSKSSDIRYADEDVNNCIKTIEAYYDGINKGDYKSSYNCTYKQKFGDYESQKQFWLESYNRITVKSITEYENQKNKDSKDEPVFKVKLSIDYKDNPSKYLTDDPTDGDRTQFITLKRDEKKVWKIYKFSVVP